MRILLLLLLLLIIITVIFISLLAFESLLFCHLLGILHLNVQLMIALQNSRQSFSVAAAAAKVEVQVRLLLRLHNGSDEA